MPITFTCSCGKILRVADEHAGRRVKCPVCNAVGSVPAPEVEPVFEVEEPRPLLARPPAAPPSRPQQQEEEEYDGTVYGLAKSGGGGGSSSSSDAEDDDPRDKPLPDFRLGSGQRGKKRKKK